MKESLIDFWIRSGIITNKKVIEAFKKIPREEFVLKEFKDEAYVDQALPLIKGQTISQPTTVMIMTQALEIKPNQKILEIGTGSGYQAALISYLVGEKGKVYTIERIPELVEFAKNNIKKLKIKNIKIIEADGSKGYPKARPFDRIIITAACKEIPKGLINQLKNNGILVAPIGPTYSQKMIKLKKKKNKIETTNLGDFVFVPLIED
jgi:protein-L-isoaspartate(D-aspartate) O-methyltransferase